jgi:hypothetical protein
MPSSWMLRCVAIVRTDVSEELSASFIRVTRIAELGTSSLGVSFKRASVASYSISPILVTLMKEELICSETSVLTRATRNNILEDAILHLLTSDAIKFRSSAAQPVA